VRAGALLIITLLLSAAAGPLGTSGCARKGAVTAAPWSPATASDLGAVVAKVGEVPIFAEEVADQAARTGKPPRQALDDLVAFHLLAEHARAAGAWPPDGPEAARLRKEVLVQRMLERELEPGVGPEDITDAELRALYDKALITFVHPRLVEVAVLEITPGRRATPAVRAEARENALALVAAVRAGKGQSPADLQVLASDEGWHRKRVRYTRFLQGPNGPKSTTFAAAVTKLRPGETSGLIEDEYGLYVARYAGERPAKNVTFEEAKAELRTGFYPRWRLSKFLEFADQAAAKHEVEIRQLAGAGSGP
jgi:hypothetical protein